MVSPHCLLVTVAGTDERAGHSATLTTTLEQGSDSTKVSWRLEGVPLGMEEETQRNLQGY